MSSAPPLPATFTGQTDEVNAQEEARAIRNTTMAERARVLESLCRLAAELTAQHADPQRVLDWQDPLSPETEATLARLRSRWRGHG